MEDSINRRLSQVEAAVRELQQQKSVSIPNWLQEVTGFFADDPVFDEILAYGKELRQSDRPSDDESD